MKFLPPENHMVKGLGTGLSLDKVIIPEALRENGYVTSSYGKWHLGHNALDMVGQGFDEGFEMLGHYNFKTLPAQDDIDNSLYSSDVVAEKTINFMKRAMAEGKPFFSYVPFYLVHRSLEPKPEYLACLSKN
jgi:arylsulfatase A-like enzyme